MKQQTMTVAVLGAVLALATSASALTPLNAIISVDDPAGNAGDARVRVVHASPDAPAVDVLVNDGVVFGGLPFEGITDFAAVPAGTYNVKVVPAGATSPVVIEADLTLEAMTDYTVIATDRLDSITPVILTATGGTPDAGNAWARFLHGSPDAPAVDIAVTGGPTLFSDVAFQEGTDYLPVPAGTYDLEARIAGTSTVALALPGITLEDGMVYTVYATGLVDEIVQATIYHPVVATITGQAGTNFVTDVRVLNRSGEDARVTVDYFEEGPNGNMAPTASATVDVASNQQLAVNDLVGSVFGLTNSKGGVIITANRDVSAFARIFNDQRAAGEGTFGQFQPGLPLSHGWPSGAVPFLSNEAAGSGEGFRANLGWFNPNMMPVDVTFQGWDADGTLLGEISATANPYEQQQFNVGDLWPALATYGDLYITYSTDGSNLFVYGSLVDNVNGDAIYIAATPAQ